jgi:hypothetical protein
MFLAANGACGHKLLFRVKFVLFFTFIVEVGTHINYFGKYFQKTPRLVQDSARRGAA